MMQFQYFCVYELDVLMGIVSAILILFAKDKFPLYVNVMGKKLFWIWKHNS